MKRVKALGFISILEREFGIELVSLKDECTEYFSSYPDEEFDAKLVVTVPEAGDYTSGNGSKFLVLLILFAIGYGAWYLFVAKGDLQEKNTTFKNTSFLGAIVNQAEAWLGNSSQLDQNDIPIVANGIWASSNDKNDTTAVMEINKSSIEENKSMSTDEQNDSVMEEQIIKKVKQEQQENFTDGKLSENIGDINLENISEDNISNVNTDTSKADNTPAIAADDLLAVEVPSMADEVNADEIVSMTKKDKPRVQPKVKTEKKPLKKNKGKKVVIFHPLKKVWVGYTNLSTMKRAAKVIEEDIDFDTNISSWILVSGHNAINFIVKGKSISPKKREKNYFLIKDGKVKSISQEEFQKLNKSTVW